VAEPEPLRASTPAVGLGLRAQITIALLIGLGLSVVLTAVSADRLATRALERERENLAELVAAGVAREVRRAGAPPLLIDRAEETFLGRDGVVGFELLGDDETVESRGIVGIGIFAESELEGGRVRAWVQSPSEDAARSLVGLLVLYATVGALGILVLSFVLLTRLIVRPVEALTRASERLAEGRPDARAPVGGAAEVARLSVSFNAMSDDLRKERAALTARLAELEQTTRELRAAQASLVRSEKLASVGRLSAGIAHEIGNPLTSILGLVELLRGGGLEPDEQAEFLKRIQGETERIHRIIRDLLDFARANPETAADHGETDLKDVVDRAVTLVAPQKDLRRITIERRIPEDLPKVRGTEDRWTQVLLNLLLNAADAIEGEGTISIALEHDEEDRSVLLSVADTGPGIAKEVRDRLFEPFVTTKPPGSGTGLGLAVCLTLVEDLGGTLEAGDAPGGGARFVAHAKTA
jgi:two-component system NtrC family sensor kinase